MSMKESSVKGVYLIVDNGSGGVEIDRFDVAGETGPSFYIYIDDHKERVEKSEVFLDQQEALGRAMDRLRSERSKLESRLAAVERNQNNLEFQLNRLNKDTEAQKE